MYVGIVYRIFYGDLSYIGSTIDLKQRMLTHNGINNSCSSKEIMCYDYEVEVLAEIYYVENHLDINLRNLEREYIDQYKCINKIRPIITKEEQKECIKKCQKEYKKTDKYKECQKKYEKSDKRKEYKKEYQKLDKYKQYMKEYYLKNKSK